MSTSSHPLGSGPGEQQELSSADRRMAEILASAPNAQRTRQELREESSEEAEDLLGRLNALDFVSQVVGEASDVPERLGDYRIVDLLGRGGMGTVYTAWQETLEREVALKVLSPTLSADPTMRRRFRIEARATASLHHQHIVPIFDYGEAAGLMYFAMEKVHGVSLDKHIAAARRQGRALLDPRDAARRFAGVADALGHAHRRKILHRDVKPGNLLVNLEGTLALADFGLSKVIGEQSMSRTGGAFLGTLMYASPEQAIGRELTPASDLYSLGVTIFEAVSGELPLEGKTTESMLQALLHGSPRRLRDIVPKASRDLEAILDKLLQREPGDRYQDGEALARDLQRVADGEPVRLRRQSLVVRLWRRVRRNPGVATATAVSVLLLLVSGWLLWTGELQRRRSSEMRYESELQQALIAAQREPGAAGGPVPAFEVLVGRSAPETTTESKALAGWRNAQLANPSDRRPVEFSEAYRDDSLDEKLESSNQLLLQGQGAQALRLLDEAIRGSELGLTTRDERTLLWLYRYHVMRAVAALTASVHNPGKARESLISAKFLRPGAFFPQLLLAVVEWQPADGVEQLLPRVEALVRSGPENTGTVAGWMLLTLANVRRAPRAQWMAIDIPYGERKKLHAAAIALLDGVLPPPPVRWTGLEADLAGFAQRAIDGFGDRGAVQQAVDGGLALLRAVEPGSPLQAWTQVFAVLREPSLLPAERGTPAAQQIAGWLRLLELEPPASLVATLRRHWTQLTSGQPETLAMARLQTLLAAREGAAGALRDAADRWHWLDTDDPEPILMRFQGSVLAGDVNAAGVAGAEALYLAADRELVRGRIVKVLEEASATSQLDWRPLLESFRNG
jgi:serine/threonine protein kinase